MASGIDTVIFDMDGVIFDSEILVLQAWKEVAERHGIAGVEAACHECTCRPKGTHGSSEFFYCQPLHGDAR